MVLDEEIVKAFKGIVFDGSLEYKRLYIAKAVHKACQRYQSGSGITRVMKRLELFKPNTNRVTDKGMRYLLDHAKLIIEDEIQNKKR